MAKAELKTKATEVSVADFIARVPDQRRREEAAVIDALYRRVTGCEPKMWGPSIIGYGSYDYTYDSGHSGTSCRAGFSPRKAALTLYAMQIASMTTAFQTSTRDVFRMASAAHPTSTRPTALEICTTVSMPPAAIRLMSNTLTHATTV